MEGLIDQARILEYEAMKVHNKFRGYADLDDLMAEGRLWLIEHPGKLQGYQDMEETRLAAWRLKRDLYRVMEKFARKERALRLGFDTRDEVYYSPEMMAKLLPRVLAGDPFPEITDRPEIRAVSDAAESGDWLASYMDACTAWDSDVLSYTERMVLMGTYGPRGASQETLAAYLGITQPSVGRARTRALQKLSDALGGTKPTGCPYDCECHEGKLRTRPGVRGNDSGLNQMPG